MSRRTLAAVAMLVVLSPIFGVWLAEAVGYAEPLDHVAEALGLEDISEQVNWTPFFGYMVPGLPDWLGYMATGAVGAAIFLAIAYLAERASKRGRGSTGGAEAGKGLGDGS